MPRLPLALLAFAAFSVDPSVRSADPEPAPEVLPADLPARPAIDLEKVAGNPALRAADVRNNTTSSNNLKKIGVALYNYASATNEKLPADYANKAGKQLLSWRVMLLPHLGEKALFERFKLDEPWDSKHNLALVEKMPKVYESPRVTVKRKGYTVYQVFSGPGALYESGKPKYGISNIPDGTTGTIFAVEAGRAVPWTKPADIPYDRAKAVPDFGKAYGGKPLASLVVGSVRSLDLKKISAGTLKSAINPADGFPLGNDW